MPSRPNVKRLARRNRFEALAAALQYHDWAQLRDASYVDLGITVRRDAVAALADSDDPRASDALAWALSDSALPVRVGAVNALAGRLEPAVATTLADAYLRFDDAGDEVQRSAALAALRSNPRITAAPVVRAVSERTGQRELTESEAGLLRALAEGGSEATELTVAALVDVLADDTDTAERGVEGLVALGGDSVPALLEAMNDHRRRAQAAIALGRCGDGRSVEALVRLLTDQRSGVRRAAAETLGDLRDPRAVAPLVAAAQDEDHETRVAAASALDRLGSAGLIVEIASISRQSGAGWSASVPGEAAQALTPGPSEPPSAGQVPAEYPAARAWIPGGEMLEQRHEVRGRGTGGANGGGVRRRAGAVGRLREIGATIATAALARVNASADHQVTPTSPTADEADHRGGAGRPLPLGVAADTAAASSLAPTAEPPARGVPPEGQTTSIPPDVSSDHASVPIVDRSSEGPLEGAGAEDEMDASGTDAVETTPVPAISLDYPTPGGRPRLRRLGVVLAALCVPIIAFAAAFAVGREGRPQASSHIGAQTHPSARLVPTSPRALSRPLAPLKRRQGQTRGRAPQPTTARAGSGTPGVVLRFRPVTSRGAVRGTPPRRVTSPAPGSPAAGGSNGATNGNNPGNSTTTTGGAAAPGTSTSSGTTTGNGATGGGIPTTTVISPTGGGPAPGNRTSTSRGPATGTAKGSR
jgi:HEAT repeat protein